MDFYKRIKVIVAGIVLTGSMLVSASVPYVESLQSVDACGYLQRARYMVENCNYVGALDQLREFTELSDKLKSERECEEAVYLTALSHYELGNSQCVRMLKEFAATYPSSEYALECKLKVGDYYFFVGDFAFALENYSEIDLSVLDMADNATYSYRKAFSLIKTGQFDEARKLFILLKQNSFYGNASQFYLAYLDYLNEDYEAALVGFRNVESGSASSASSIKSVNREYIPTGLEAGYYIAQIEFKQGKYSDVVKNGRSLLAKQPVAELIPEINRIIGESYYHLGEEESAYVFLSNYFADKTVAHNASACYIMGVIEYNRGDYEEAMSYCSQLTEEVSSRGQSANLYLGQCAMRQGNNSVAAIYFEKAYRIGYDKKVSETALYNYAVARIEGGTVPFGSSTVILEDFAKTFPTSQYAPIVDEYLAIAYYNEKSYEKALNSLNRISNPSGNVLKTKQIILYELGVEAYANAHYQLAAERMVAVEKMSFYDRQLAHQALLWLGDAYYAQGDYSLAESYYTQFTNNRLADELNRWLAYYNLGYSQYMQNKFKPARQSFEKSIAVPSMLTRQILTDAMVRIADCDYYMGNFSKARTEYANVIKQDKNHADYATMQHANMRGFLKNNAVKIAELDAMISEYPNSIWLPTAMLEKAQTCIEMGNTPEAITAFEVLVDKYPHSADAREGLLQMAIALANTGERESAEKAYKEVIMRWPSSEQAESANDDLRRIYAASGELDEYAMFLLSIPNAPRLNEDQKERLSFEAAENDIVTDENNIAKMEKYVEQYPNGRYLANALYYLIDYNFTKGDYEKAVGYIDELLTRRSDSQFVSGALLQKAKIMEMPSFGTPQAAMQVYLQLEQRGDADYMAEAYAGVMRNTNLSEQQLEYADKLLSLPGLSADEVEVATYHRGKALFAMSRDEEAIGEFEKLIANLKSEYGSRAAVELGVYYITVSEYDKAEKLLTEFVDNASPSHQYWLARGFVALADLYYAKGDTLLAVEYIDSLKANYPGNEADIFEMINQRLNEWKR